MKLLFVLLLALPLMAQTRIDSGERIHWPTCYSGQYYSPYGNLCHPLVATINGNTGAMILNGAGVTQVGNTFSFSGIGSGVSTINGTGGAFTFTGSGVSCTTTTCTFTGVGGAVWGSITGTLASQTDLAAALAALVPTTRTVNGHALSSNVTISASDLTTGTLPHTQLPALVSGDIPNNAANTSGNAATVTNSVYSINGTIGAFTFSGIGVSCSTTTCTFTGAGSGIGSITWAVPSFMTASPSTISTAGTQTFSFNAQAANSVFSGPSSGASSAPTFRSLVSADIPNNAANTSGQAGTVSTINGKITNGPNVSITGAGTSGSPYSIASTIPHSIVFQDGIPGGPALSTGILDYLTVPFACTIAAWSIQTDAGTATVKVLKVAAGTAIPTLGANSISTSGLSISAGTVIQSTTLTDFTTTAVAAYNIIAADLTAVSGAGYISFQLSCNQ